MTDPIKQGARFIDLSDRVVVSTTVVASPSGSSETIIGSVTIPGGLTLATGVILRGYAALTVGTSGASVRLRIRQTNISGTTVADTGALTGGVAAAALLAQDVNGFDNASADGQVYKLTLTVGSGAAASTVSAVSLLAIAV